MGILDKILGKRETPKKAPDFSGVSTGSGSTLGERREPSRPAEATRSKAPDFSGVSTGSGSTLGERPEPPRAAPSQPQARTYVVQSGDSLSKIAQRHYGNANEWPKIFEANRDQIKDPDLIHPGQTLKIP